MEHIKIQVRVNHDWNVVCLLTNFIAGGNTVNTNEQFTIKRSELTSGNFDSAKHSEVTTNAAMPGSPPETTIAVILAGLIQKGAVV